VRVARRPIAPTIAEEKVTVTLKPAHGAFTRVQAWINRTLVIDTDGGNGSGERSVAGPAVVAVRARGVAASEFSCTVKRGLTKVHEGAHEIPSRGVFNDEEHVRC
jgi:hypothetical protein